MFDQFFKELPYLKKLSPLTLKSYQQAYQRYRQFTSEGDSLPTKLSLNQLMVQP